MGSLGKRGYEIKLFAEIAHTHTRTHAHTHTHTHTRTRDGLENAPRWKTVRQTG